MTRLSATNDLISQRSPKNIINLTQTEMLTKFSLLLVLVATTIVSAQEAKLTHKVVQIQKQTNFNLTIASARGYVAVELPPNTVEWYIAFTSKTNSTSANAINLFGQLTRLVDPTGISSVAINSLVTPGGTSRCSVMVTDRANRLKFMNGSDHYGIFDNISRVNVTDGIIKIDGSKYGGDLQVLVYNPSYTTSISVGVEVTAIVTDEKVWPKESKQTMYDGYYSDLLKRDMGQEGARELANCVIEKICKQKSPEEVRKMSKFEFGAFAIPIAEKCVQDMRGGPKTTGQEKAASYGTLGWNAYENGNVDKCIEYSKKALELDSSMGWVQANLGLCYLIRGDSSAAIDCYVNAIAANRRDRATARKHFEIQIKDIDDALMKYPRIQGYKDIQDLLRMELKKYR